MCRLDADPSKKLLIIVAAHQWPALRLCRLCTIQPCWLIVLSLFGCKYYVHYLNIYTIHFSFVKLHQMILKHLLQGQRRIWKKHLKIVHPPIYISVFWDKVDLQLRHSLIHSYQDKKAILKIELNVKEKIEQTSFIKTWIHDENIRKYQTLLFAPPRLDNEKTTPINAETNENVISKEYICWMLWW